MTEKTTKTRKGYLTHESTRPSEVRSESVPLGNGPSLDTLDCLVVPRELWERTAGVIKTIRNSRKGSCGSIENVYCPGPMNRHGIDNLWNEIQRHNDQVERPQKASKGETT